MRYLPSWIGYLTLLAMALDVRHMYPNTGWSTSEGELISGILLGIMTILCMINSQLRRA